MKILSYIGIAIAVIALGLGIYNQIEYVPKNTDEARELFGTELWRHYHDTKMLYGYITSAGAILAILLGIAPVVKKEKLGWIALGLGLIGFFLGASQCTHMFS